MELTHEIERGFYASVITSDSPNVYQVDENEGWEDKQKRLVLVARTRADEKAQQLVLDIDIVVTPATH